MSTIAAVIAALVLAGATVAGVVASATNHSSRASETSSNVQLYGSR